MPCAGCGADLPKQRTGRPRKWCADCRPGAARAEQPKRQRDVSSVSLVDAVRAHLIDLGGQDTPRGLAALDLAIRITATDNDAAVAALHKQLLVTLQEVEDRAVPTEYDPVDAARTDLHVAS